MQGIKLIAEPWDLKPEDGDQLGNFPRGWSEWNRCFRDDARRYWMGRNSRASALATRLAGSSDVFRNRRRRPQASINLVTSHDGFTLADLVTYERKRNDANGENGRDGENWNHNWNCGTEGPDADPEISELRERLRRNLLATLFLSQGVPMLVAGDEFGTHASGEQQRLLPRQRDQLGGLESSQGQPVSRIRPGTPANSCGGACLPPRVVL